MLQREGSCRTCELPFDTFLGLVTMLGRCGGAIATRSCRDGPQRKSENQEAHRYRSYDVLMVADSVPAVAEGQLN